MKTKNQKNNFIALTKALLILSLISLGLKANAQCTAGFTYTVNPANNGEASFTNTSTINPGLGYNWDFGDGTSDNNTNHPTHIFNGIGTYYVCLTVYDTLNPYDSTSGCYKTYCDSIYVINTTATCNAHFYTSSDSLTGIYFINSSLGSITNYFWDFGDGTTSTSANPGPHTYSTGGPIEICLTTSNPATLCNSTFCDTIFTSSCEASFTYISDTIGNGCNFYGSSTGTSNNYFWDFGDGNTSILQNPYHVFSNNGYYNVCLTVSSITDSTCMNTFCQGVNMSGLCDASFYMYQVDSSNLFEYRAYINYPNKNLTYAWNFGDGSPVSTLQYPTHNYAGNGPYQICLTVAGNNSCTDTYCDSIYAGRSTGLTFTVVSQTTTGVHENKEQDHLLMNYPNPFRGITTIAYSLIQDAAIELSVVDLLGQKIALIESENKTTGNYTIQWNAENISTGIYLLQLKVNNQVSTKKLIITQ